MIQHYRRPFLWLVLCLINEISIPSVVGTAQQVEFLEQNWNTETRQAFYTTSQGSRLMPYRWFMALEVANGEESFREIMLPALGYLPNEKSPQNPDRLPVGFVLDRNELTNIDYLGLNCSACHTNQIAYGGKVFQIDGAPTMADMGGLLNAVDDAVRATCLDEKKFERFAKKVLNSDSSNNIQTIRLKKELRAFQEYWSRLVKDSSTKHPWGRGRLDAFGMIFNRVAAIDLHLPSNNRSPDAPVSYPFLRGTSFQDRVQWNGVAPNTSDFERLGRNVGEVLGVFGEAEFAKLPLLKLPEYARTSAKRLNQVKLENQLKELWSPKWPTHFGELDENKRRSGELLYREHCMACHAIVPHMEQNTPINVVMTSLSEVGTDPKMAMNAAFPMANTGHAKWLFEGRDVVPRGELLQRLVKLSVISPFRDVRVTEGRPAKSEVFETTEILAFLRELGLVEDAAQSLLNAYDQKLDAYIQDLNENIELSKSSFESASNSLPVNGKLAYKAAPLAGIWATAPYLHNGSVPNLYELLLPAHERSNQFYVGSRDFDPVKVGFSTDQASGTTLFDTKLEGNRNSGHDHYGTFTDQERWQLVEFLKSL